MAPGRRGAIRWLRRGAILLAVLSGLPALFVAAQIGQVWFGQPNLDGERSVPGLAAEATISRDERGVVHIKAASEPDAYFALGYAHAQDRFFQMEALRRIAAGRLSELMGSPTADFDRRMRTLGVARLAATDEGALSPEARIVYAAYADGVNAWLKTRKGVAADELTLLLAPEPEPWRVEHSLAWNRLMSLRLTGNWASELMRLRLSAHLSPEQLADLWPGYDPNGPVSAPDIPAATIAAAAEFAKLAGVDDGSNGWVVAGDRARNGAAMLANDPHLGLTTPSVWHLARIEAPGLLLAGATAPGVPAMILGHNGHIAWGLTNAATDTSDVYAEPLAPADPNQYLTPDGPKTFETRSEKIVVRFGDDIEFDVRETRHGPVISDGRDYAPEGAVLALSHTGLKPAEGSAETVFRINRARSWADAKAAARVARGPQQNLFYAGPDGIALATVAALPVRGGGDGYMPADGASTEGDWIALAGVDAMPQVVNPARGWAANANNKIAHDDFPLWLGRQWGHPGRAFRVEEMLETAGPLDLDGMADMQMDDVSPVGRQLAAAMVAMTDQAPLTESQKRLLDQVAEWDLQTDVDSARALIFFAWAREAVRVIFQDEMGDAFAGWFNLRAEPLAHVLQTRPIWCDDTRTDATEACDAMLARSLAAAEAWLIERHGDDPSAWRWGEAHQARFRHLAFGFIPGLKQLFDVRLPAPGGLETVNRAAFRAGAAENPFDQVHGPTLRAVYDVADLSASQFVIGPGQSGRLFSPNRSNMAELWRDGGRVSLAPLAEPAHVLRLLPQ